MCTTCKAMKQAIRQSCPHYNGRCGSLNEDWQSCLHDREEYDIRREEFESNCACLIPDEEALDYRPCDPNAFWIEWS